MYTSILPTLTKLLNYVPFENTKDQFLNSHQEQQQQQLQLQLQQQQRMSSKPIT